MKKLVVLAVLILTSVSMFSQITSQGKPDVLKSFRMGVCKLVDTNGEITIEAVTRETEQRGVFPKAYWLLGNNREVNGDFQYCG